MVCIVLKKIKLHSHWSLLMQRVVTYSHLWSNMLNYGPWICIVGLLAPMMSLFRVHSLTIRVKFGFYWW